MGYMIETRTTETECRHAGEWTPEGMGEIMEYASADEAEATIQELRTLGPDWSEAEYRVVSCRRRDDGALVRA